MLIQCPRCSTGWRVPDAPPTDNPTFKCGRCHHIFREFPGAPAPGERRPGAARRATVASDVDNLEFIFPSRRGVPPTTANGARGAASTDAAATPNARLPVGDVRRAAPTRAADGPDRITTALDEPRPPADERDAFADEPDALADRGGRLGDVHTLGDVSEFETRVGPDDDLDATFDLPDDESGELLGAGDDLEDDDTGDAEDDAVSDVTFASEIDVVSPAAMSRALHVEDTMHPSHGIGSYARLLLALVALHAVLALVIRLAPDWAGSWLAHVPLAGQLFRDEPTLAREVELRNITGGYQRLRNARRVFVIAGDAVNTSATPVDRIQVEARLYGATGEIDHKVVNTGNRTALTDLTEPEIVLLQRLDPRTTVRPGESSAFLVVFLEPPRDLREFSSRVLSVRPTRPALSSHPGTARQPPASVG